MYDILPMMLYLNIFSMPLAGFGMMKLVEWIKTKLLVRKGYFRAYFRLANHRKMMKMVRPDKSSITIQIGMKEKIYPFSNGIGYIYFNGNTPEIEYDLNGDQINFVDREKTSTLDPDNLSSLGQRTYNLGKRAGRRKDQLILIVAIIAAGAAVFNVMLMMGLMQSM